MRSLTRASVVLAVPLLLGALIHLAPAHASWAALAQFHVRPTEVGVDVETPPRPSIRVLAIYRGRGLVQYGEQTSVVSGGEHASIEIQLNATDDRTPKAALGWRIHYVDGALPDGCKLTSDTLLAVPRINGEFDYYVDWTDGATWDQEPFSFRVFMTCMDWAGNESVPSDTVLVAHDGDTSEWQLFNQRQMRRRNADELPLVPDDEPFAEVLREYYGAIVSGHFEQAYQYFTIAPLSFTNRDGSKTICPLPRPFDEFQSRLRECELDGATIEFIKRYQPFVAGEGEGSAIAGVREYVVRLKRDSSKYPIYEERIAAVRGTDGQVRLLLPSYDTWRRDDD